MKTLNIVILGASGYTGAELIRLLDRHPHARLVALGAHGKAGMSADTVFPHLPSDFPLMQKLEDMPIDDLDVLFTGLPHGTAGDILPGIITAHPNLRIIDLSADFRFDDAELYQKAYDKPHPAPDILAEGVYGLSEIYREAIKTARLVACPGCYCTAANLGLIPLVQGGLISTEDIIIDAKSGISGAGRAAKSNLMFTEVNQGLSAYSIGNHRHMWEIEQELSKAAGQRLYVSFTPHLIPISRGILANSYVRLTSNTKVADLQQHLADFYADAPFIRVLELGQAPKTQNVFGSNTTEIAVFPDHLLGRAVVLAAIDNLMKGASGQAVQNMNLMFGFDETAGLDRIALYP
ncbi:MAG: N-acetyl-gamma-glutamyl-phosphate reductase [Alphaproteobacteria bacterium]|nr:N-acetyl-gamma-glutamyl-phosphate reductase [Alphaproteobacteria bacterium]